MPAIEFPPAPTDGSVHSDANEKLWVYSSAKNRWNPMASPMTDAMSGEVSPVAPGAYIGQQYFDTVAETWYRWTGDAWQEDAGVSAAVDVSVTPGGSIAATNVQAALEELAGGGGLTEYEIASSQGRRLIDSLKAAWTPTTGLAYFSTMKCTAGTITVKTSTGWGRLIGPDGAIIAGTGGGNGAANSFTLSLPFAGGHRAYAVLSVANSGASTSVGDITLLTANDVQLTAVDVASATQLTALECRSNQLTALNVTSNTLLQTLLCFTNQLTALDVSNKTALTTLSCFSNQLTALNVTGAVALAILTAYSNQLTTLDVSTNLLLTNLSASTNQLPTAVIDQILVDLSVHNVAGTNLSLGGPGNGAPGDDGLAAINDAGGLLDDGWTNITVNS